MNRSRWTPIVVSYEPGPELTDCVRSLLEAGASEVVVWDNSPSSAARSLVGGHSQVRILGDSTNYGFGSANNRAYQTLAERPDYVFFVNPDCSVGPETANELIAAIERSGDLAIVVPKMIYADGAAGIAGGPFPTMAKEIISATRLDDLLPRSWREKALSIWSWRQRRSENSGYNASFASSGVARVDWVSGFAMMCRSDVLDAVGGFCEKYFLYFEDVDLCRRIADAGYHVAIVNDTSATHLESVSTGAAKKSMHYRNGRRTYYRLHGNRFQRALATLL